MGCAPSVATSGCGRVRPMSWSCCRVSLSPSVAVRTISREVLSTVSAMETMAESSSWMKPLKGLRSLRPARARSTQALALLSARGCISARGCVSTSTPSRLAGSTGPGDAVAISLCRPLTLCLRSVRSRSPVSFISEAAECTISFVLEDKPSVMVSIARLMLFTISENGLSFACLWWWLEDGAASAPGSRSETLALPRPGSCRWECSCRPWRPTAAASSGTRARRSMGAMASWLKSRLRAEVR
mmetsp:Transcript_74420/g.210574  ORF Transcript_74420/g.210574 Transcript_74420/m.210574 type:complete len:243 (-) Transcript_74420:40-768(-)